MPLTDMMAFKGMMLTGLPNMAFTVGYTNASWTLKADLVSEFVCRCHQLHGCQRLPAGGAATPRRHSRRAADHGFHPGLCAARP